MQVAGKSDKNSVQSRQVDQGPKTMKMSEPSCQSRVTFRFPHNVLFGTSVPLHSAGIFDELRGRMTDTVSPNIYMGLVGPWPVSITRRSK